MERTRSGPALAFARRAAALTAAAFCILSPPAIAAPQTRTVDAPAGWTVGALPAPAPAPVETGGAAGRRTELFGLQDKYRVGGALLPWLQPYAALSPWVSATPGAGGAPLSSGGVLLDVPVGGGFTFTPSIGAGYTPNRLRPEGEAVEFRSQLEIGYAFDNNARVTLGYTRMRGTGGGRDDGEMLGFTFRLPFGALTGD
ncbi:hypothetical protein M2352_003681 [Azospirillum fermentarium]|uniref:hypothetical protein n=1 Tax=Azospirillum fermentarium TaxID=1233114 RepID=UPI0022260C2C|nr:hypothetical protein [Azospirillum fermentarium]MCW2248047.1 hypothetical protein [Azospirillum fermentarium]